MRWKRFSIGAAILGLGVGGLRVGVRHLFRPEVSSHQSTRPCGALVWRTTTVTRKSRSEPVPVLVSEESVVELDGRAIVSEVAHFRCVLGGRSLTMTAAVVSHAGSERANVSIYRSSGALERVVPFEHDVETTWWSSDGAAFAAVGSKGEVSIAGLHADTKPVVVAHGKSPVGGRVTWSADGKSACFVTGNPPAAEPGSAELWCSTVPAPAVSVARAAWNGSGTAVPWAGFEARTRKVHLCGDDLQPRDPSCLGISREAD